MSAARLALVPTVLALALACTGPTPPDTDTDSAADDTSTPDSGTDTPDDSGEVIDPNIPTGNVASVYLVGHLDEPGVDLPETELYGVFTDDDQGFAEAARCVATGRCATESPSGADAWVDNDSTLRFDTTASRSFRFADKLRLGGHTADLATEGSFTWYEGSHPTGWQPGQAMGLSTDVGDWGPYVSTRDITLPSVYLANTPSPAAQITAVSDEPIPFTWAAGDGDVYLDLFAGDLWRTWSLVDDGSFELDLSEVPFPAGVTTATIELSRQSTGAARINGNQIDLIARSVQRYSLKLTNINGRDRLTPSATCADVAGAAPTEPGAWFGRVDGATSALNPGSSGCAGVSAPAAEGFLKVEVPPSNKLSATYTLPGAKPVLYVLTDCSNTGSCLVGDGESWSVGSPATVNWLNTGTDTATVYLVLDANDANGLFTLDLAIREINVLVPYETCDEALAADPIGAGSYEGSLATLVNDLSMPSSCTGYSTPGKDGFVKLHLEAGETVDVSYDTPGYDAAVYLLDGCGSAPVCLDGDDHGSPEQVTYTATGPKDIILGLDAYSSSPQSFTAEIDIH